MKYSRQNVSLFGKDSLRFDCEYSGAEFADMCATQTDVGH